MITFSDALFPSRVLDDAAKLVHQQIIRMDKMEPLTSLAWCRWRFHPFEVPFLIFQ